MFGNNMATKIRIADILRIIQIMWIVCAKTYKQNCLGHTYKERVGITARPQQTALLSQIF